MYVKNLCDYFVEIQKRRKLNIALSNVEPAIEKYYLHNSWISLGFTNHYNYIIGIFILLYSRNTLSSNFFFEI
jgi:hypothetical protein